MIDISKLSGNLIDKSHIFHSHGMGRAVQGSSMGAASTETFARRQAIETNRAHVGNYRQANIHIAARPAMRPFTTGLRSDVTPPARPSGNPPAHTFHDAPHHRYDPYAN